MVSELLHILAYAAGFGFAVLLVAYPFSVVFYLLTKDIRSNYGH